MNNKALFIFVILLILLNHSILLAQDYPDAIWIENTYPSRYTVVPEDKPRTINRIIIHATGASTAQSTINEFTQEDPKRINASSHYLIDKDGIIYQFVLEKNIAHHAKNYNQNTIGIELVSADYQTNPKWVTEKMYKTAADLVRYLCQKYNIPLDRNHIKGHDDVDYPRKVDPGKYWDWSRFMKLLKGGGDDQISLFDFTFIDTAWALEITIARDPNFKLVSPEGNILPGQQLTYKVEYENEGEGIAFGVYFTDTLDTDLDDTTLQIGPVIDINTGQTISEPGTYNPKTRTITWFVGEVSSKQGGYTNFSIDVKDNTPNNSEIINFATVYFPSVPESTRTNGTVNRVTTYIDNTPPTTTASTSPSPNQSGWNNTDATITLTAQDNQGGSGISKTEYSLDNLNWLTYTAPFTITSEGTTTLYYKSTDNTGNIESIKTLTIKFDKTSPTITATTSPQPNSHNWNNTDVTVTFSATDALSGIASVTAPIIVTTEGANQYIGGEAIDFADNKSTTYVIINLDKTPPDITLTLNPVKPSDEDDEEEDEDDEEGNWYKLIYSATDNLSGLQFIKAGLIILPIEGYKIELEQDDELEIKINQKKKELNIESPNPEEILSQLQSGLLNLNNNQILQLKIKQGEPKWKIKEKDDKGIEIQAPSMIFKAEAVDYADNTLTKELAFKKEKKR